MDSQPIAVRSVINPRFLEFCLSEQYAIGEWAQCLFWLKGLNDTYKIRTSSGFYILRLYRSEVNENDVSFELSTLLKLNDILSTSSTKVSRALYKKDGSLYTVIQAPEGPRVAVIFDYIDGHENVLHDDKSCYAFGQSAAELHAAMDHIVVAQPHRYELNTQFLIEQPLARIVTYIGETHEAVPFLTQYAEELKASIHHAAKSGLDWGLCHGDMHGNNNAFQIDSHFIHYDFEFTANGWRAYDLAQVKSRKRQPVKESQHQLWDSVMSGYRSIRSFSVQDEQAIDLFIAVRRFWVMSMDVAFIHSDFGALDYGEEWLNSFIEEFRKRFAYE